MATTSPAPCVALTEKRTRRGTQGVRLAAQEFGDGNFQRRGCALDEIQRRVRCPRQIQKLLGHRRLFSTEIYYVWNSLVGDSTAMDLRPSTMPKSPATGSDGRWQRSTALSRSSERLRITQCLRKNGITRIVNIVDRDRAEVFVDLRGKFLEGG